MSSLNLATAGEGLTTQQAAQGPWEWDKCGAGCRLCSWILVQCLVQLFYCHRDNETPLSSDLTQSDGPQVFVWGLYQRWGGCCFGLVSNTDPLPSSPLNPENPLHQGIRKQGSSPQLQYKKALFGFFYCHFSLVLACAISSSPCFVRLWLSLSFAYAQGPE